MELQEIRNTVRSFFADALGRQASEIPDDAHFITDLGGDSLAMLEMAVKAEDLYGITLPEEDFARCGTVADISRLISDRINGEPAEAPAQAVKPVTRFEDAPEWIAFSERLKSAGEDNPYFVAHESPLTDVSLMDGRTVLNFGSYNYVGMSGRKEVEEAAKAAIDKYGTSASGSRLLGGEKMLHKELEAEIASWKHAEASLVLVGGHSTNVTVVGNFCGRGDLIVYDALSHNSIHEGCRLSDAVSKSFPNNDFAALDRLLAAQRDQYAKVLIVIEGAYSMDGDIAPVPEFVALKKKYGCFLMVDEAHSSCVIGKTGGGVDEYFGLDPEDIDIKMGTLSKGPGACGGYIAGKRCLIEYMRYNLPGFVFSVGIPPAMAAAALTSIRLLRSDPSIIGRLHDNIRTFLDEAHKRGLNTCLAAETAIVPILIGGDNDAFRLSLELGKKGVFVPPAVYPAVPRNKARLRFCVISEHHPDQIRRALDLLVETAKEMNIPLPAAD